VVGWGCLSSTTVVESVRPLSRRDRPALDREVVSRSDSLLRREEAATEWTSTMAMELETKNQRLAPQANCFPLPSAPNVEVVL
jgi:hypothetical protein